jgi:hypothetical protein
MSKGPCKTKYLDSQIVALVQLLLFFDIPSSTSSVKIAVKLAYFEGSVAWRSCNLCKCSTHKHHVQILSYINRCNVPRNKKKTDAMQNARWTSWE